MSSFNKRSLLQQVLTKKKNYPILNKMKKGQFNLEEFIIFLRLYFQDSNIYFKEAKAMQNFMKSIREGIDYVHRDDRLSKIEEIFFYGSSDLSYSAVDDDPKKDDILDQDLKDDTLNRFVEDLGYYFPLMPVNTRLCMATCLVGFFHNI